MSFFIGIKSCAKLYKLCSSISGNMSKLKGITVKKNDNFSEWYTQVVQKAELADIRYDVQGFIVHMPWATRITRKIYEYFEEAVEADSHEPMLLPTVIPEESLKKEQEHAGFMPEVFWVTEAGTQKLERKFALRPTGETQIYPMYSLWIRSHNDLPFKRYQSRITTFRNEMQTRPFLRGREFLFFETHDVFETHESAMEQIKKDMSMMTDVVQNKLFIPFVFLKRPQWDKFLGADNTFTSDTLNPDGKRVQISSTHDLGQNFAKPFNVKFTSRDGKEQYAYQTCFGPGIWRILASIIAIHGDDNGLVLPFELAPIQVVIIPILFSSKQNESKKIAAYCSTLRMQLQKSGYRVHFDARDHISPGEKYNIWELKGVPLRIEIGPREAASKTVTITRRTDRERIQTKAVIKEITKQSKVVDKHVREHAQHYFKNNTASASSLSDVKKILEQHRGFVLAPFCSTEKDGKLCADELKAETTAYICGTPLQEKKPKNSTCIVCKKPAQHIVYIAKSI